MIVIETERLTLREVDAGDGAFVHALHTDPDFLAQIGDRGIRTREDADAAIRERFRLAYAADGYGMWLVERTSDGAKLGMAGLVNRPGLDHVDVGYAFLPEGRGHGYALEAVRGVLAFADCQGIAPVVAIVSPGNAASIRILERAGLVADRRIRLPGAENDVLLFVPAEEDSASGKPPPAIG